MKKRDLINTKEAANIALATFDAAYGQMFEMFTIGLNPEQIDTTVVNNRVIENISSMIESGSLKTNGVVIDSEVSGYVKNIIQQIKECDSFVAFGMDFAAELPDSLPVISNLVEYAIVYPEVNIKITIHASSDVEILEKVRSGKWEMSTSDVDVIHSLDNKDFQSVLVQVLSGIEHGILSNVLITEII